MHHSHLRALSVLLVLALRLPVSSQMSAFAPPHTITDQLLGVRDVHTADLDGDGDPDILSVSANDGTVAWYENLGGGQIGPLRVIETQLYWANKVRTADLDADGLLDVLVASNAGSISWWQNLGGGNFGPRVVITDQAAYAASVSAGDLDGDGDLDVIAAAPGDDSVLWYENQGDTFSTRRVITSNSASVYDVVAADMDNDGDQDVLVASQFGFTYSWFENVGGGLFGTEHIIDSQAVGAVSIQAADLDNDGDLDVVGAAMFEGSVSWYENLGGGVFSAEHVLINQALPILKVVVGDLDGDADLDVVATESNHNFLWFENLGNSTFGSAQLVDSQPPNPLSASVADIDGDGDGDIVAGLVLGKVVWYPSQFHIPESPSLLRSFSRPGEDAGAILAAPGDLNGDGQPDLIVGDPEWPGNKGTLRAWSPATQQVLWTVTGLQPGAGFGKILATAGDLNGDGANDLLIGLPQPFGGLGEVRVLSGSDGSLLQTLQAPAPNEAFGSAVAGGGDWDADGVPDIAVGAPLHDAGFIHAGAIHVYSGATGALLQTLTGVSVGERLGRSLYFVPDRNGDGHDELMGAHQPILTIQRSVLSIWAGGSGTLLGAISTLDSGTRFGENVDATQDVNGDGTPEILVAEETANGGNGRVWLFDGASLTLIRSHDGTSSMGFGHAISFAGDINGDGHEDYMIGAPEFTNADGTASGRVFLVDGVSGQDITGALADNGLSPDVFEGNRSTRLGSALARWTDQDADGFDEFVVGLPGAGRAWIYEGLNPASLYSPCAAGAVGEDIVLIEGSAGGPGRHVMVPVNTPFSFTVAQPSLSPSPATFLIMGFLGVPTVSQQTTLLGAIGGTFCFPVVGLNAASFTLTDNIAPSSPQIIPSLLTPWVVNNPIGLPVPFKFTFQGIITVAPGDMRITNAIILELTP